MKKQYAFLSCAKKCVNDSHFSPVLHKDRRVTLNKKQKNEISDSTAYITENHQTIWSIIYMVTPATEASMMAVGHFSNIFDPGKNGLQQIDDSVTRLKNELAENDPNVFFSYVSFSGDDTERPAELCSLETFLKQDMDVNDKVIIIADTRHTRRWSERKIDPTLCKGDLAFFCNCPTTGKCPPLGTWAHSWYPMKCG